MFKKTDTPYPANIQQLTSLRFVMALAIVLFHCCGHLPFKITITQLPSKGYLAVDLFFILSGFILSHVYMEDLVRGIVHPREFYIKRLARIYPVYLFTLLLSILIPVTFLQLFRYMDTAADIPGYFSDFPVWRFLANLLMVHAWGWDRTILYSFNKPSWSISAEWFAYLLFPMLVICLRRVKGLPLLIFATTLFATFSVLTSHFWDLTLTESTTNFGLWRIMPEFLGGMALYRVGRSYRLSYSGHRVFAAFAGAALLLMHFGAPDPLIILFFGALIVIAAEQARSGVKGLMTFRTVVYLGEISYSLYMLHFIMIENLFWAWPVLLEGDTVTPFTFYLIYGLIVLSSLPAAALCHHFVEQPARRWMIRTLLRGGLESRKIGNDEMCLKKG